MRRKKGFTLIELMIVIAILGVICAFLVPIIAEEVDNKKPKKPVVVTQPAAARPAAPSVMDNPTENFKNR